MSPKKLSQKYLPRIACIGAESLNPSHGTGSMFSRHFSNYPKSKIVDIHFQELAKNHFFQKVNIPRREVRYLENKSPLITQMNSCIAGKMRTPGISMLYRGFIFEPVPIDWKKFGGPPDLIYSTCFSAGDFAFLHHIYRNLPKKVPIIQHFLDLDLDEYADLVDLFRELSPAIVALWSLTIPINYAVSEFSFMKPELVQALQQPLSKTYEKTHRKFSKDFRSMIIGNIWSGNAFKSLEKIWTECQTKLKNLPAITWTGHPRRFHELRFTGIQDPITPKGRVIKDGGFLSNHALKAALQKADIAIVAFTGDVIDKHHYTQFSMPSRMGDYCANGLPIVMISQKNTEPGRIVEEAGMGIVVDPSDPVMAARKVSHFIFDRDWRAECGQKSREFAEKHLNLETYQKTLYPKLCDLAKHDLPQKFLQSHFSR